VQGTLAEGKVRAEGITVNTSTELVTGKKLTWEGEVEGVLQEGQRKAWSLGGDDFELSKDGKTQIYTKGHATDGEVIVRADRVEYTKETDVLVAKGNVKYFGVDANMLCDEATVYRKERRSVFAGTVRMVIKSEDDTKVSEGDFPTIERITPESLKTNPQGATQEQVDALRNNDNVRKFPIKVISDKVEYWYKKGERRAVITGNPFARQDLPEGWRNAWAIEAFYDGEKETLTMKSNPGKQDARMILSIGDDYSAIDFTMSTKEGDQSMKGTSVKANVYVDDDEVPVRNSGGGSTTGGGGGSTGGGGR
jgi:lipopolysaccharide export system protein LptA